MKDRILEKKPQSLAIAFISTLAIIFTFGAGTTVSAQTAHVERAKDQKSASPANTEGAARAPGQQAANDDQTGKLRQPTSEDLQELAEALQKFANRPIENLKATYHANGAISVELTEEFMEVSVIQLNPDGTTSVYCVTGMKAATKMVEANAAASSGSGRTATSGAIAKPATEAAADKPSESSAKAKPGNVDKKAAAPASGKEQ
jgi:hypothetical protein